MTIRPSTEEDWQILKSIRLAALLDSPSAFGLSHAIAAAYSELQWRDRASNKTQPQFLLALEHDIAVGLIGDTINPDHEYNLIAMWVRPEYRGSGIAARLVDAVKARALAKGYKRVVLSVSPDNLPAANFYRRQGFIFLSEWETLNSHPGIDVQKMEWQATP